MRCYLGVADKQAALPQSWPRGGGARQVAYIGDDVNDRAVWEPVAAASPIPDRRHAP